MRGRSEQPPRDCRCGHTANAHTHYRAGTDCGHTGCTCNRYRPARTP